ncbi:MAG: hypothetical protein O2809_09875 [Proteobacteria bacterium]|nr:hypothetical protein [Pseudomonadota bacterium]
MFETIIRIIFGIFELTPAWVALVIGLKIEALAKKRQYIDNKYFRYFALLVPISFLIPLLIHLLFAKTNLYDIAYSNIVVPIWIQQNELLIDIFFCLFMIFLYIYCLFWIKKRSKQVIMRLKIT